MFRESVILGTSAISACRPSSGAISFLTSPTVVTFLVSLFLRRTRESLPWSWSAVLTWGGLRGALSMVLVLGLPAEFPYRELLVHMTFGVVLLSILIQGLTMKFVLRWLGLMSSPTA